jgi:hypothetical protein
LNLNHRNCVLQSEGLVCDRMEIIPMPLAPMLCAEPLIVVHGPFVFLRAVSPMEIPCRLSFIPLLRLGGREKVGRRNAVVRKFGPQRTFGLAGLSP